MPSGDKHPVWHDEGNKKKGLGGTASPRKRAENIGGLVFTKISARKNNARPQKS